MPQSAHGPLKDVVTCKSKRAARRLVNTYMVSNAYAELLAKGVQLRYSISLECLYLSEDAYIPLRAVVEASEHSSWLEMPGAQGPGPATTVVEITESYPWLDLDTSANAAGAECGSAMIP